MMKQFSLFLFLILFLLVCSKALPQSSFGNVVDFDGNGDYANTFNRPYLPTINGTIEAWVKVTSILPPGGNEGEAFIAKNEEQWNNGDFYAFFGYSDRRLKSRIQKAPSIEVDVISNGSFLPSVDQWFHYAFTWGVYGMKMYINGVLQSNHNSLTYSALNNDYNFYVGAHGYMLHNGQYVVSDFFNGQIDELRIWNYQKNSQQINSLREAPLDSAYFVSIDSGLVGYWRFDVLEDLGINNDGPDDVRDFSILHNHLDLAGDAHLVLPNPIVPIELISFDAEPIDGKIKLNWITATEINNYGFEIERCSEETEWRTIGFINGNGTTTELKEYSFIDDLFGCSSEKVYYRLKQLDFNGNYEYTYEIEVSVALSEFYLSNNYPNPFNPETTIEFSIPRKTYVKLIVYDSIGNNIAILQDGFKEAGYYRIEFDGTNLPSGIYLYTLSADDYISTKKMILLK